MLLLVDGNITISLPKSVTGMARTGWSVTV